MKQYAPAAARNREPIAAALADLLPPRGLVLEIASGSGEHALFFARHFSGLLWQPSDPSADARASIEDWRQSEGCANMLPVLEIDAAAADWPIESADAIFCANMAHISPLAATLGLLAGAAKLLAPGAPLIFYGPWLERDVPTAASNRAFDESLKSRDPQWGLREAEWLDEQAASHGFGRSARIAMPANNLILVYRRSA